MALQVQQAATLHVSQFGQFDLAQGCFTGQKAFHIVEPGVKMHFGTLIPRFSVQFKVVH